MISRFGRVTVTFGDWTDVGEPPAEDPYADLGPFGDPPIDDMEAKRQAQFDLEELRRQRARKHATATLLAEDLAAQQDGERGRAVDGASFILDAPAEVPTLWGTKNDIGWAAGESLMIVGPPGVGKTTLVNQLVRARLGLADQVLGMPVTPGAKRVLYLAMDRPSQIQRAMARVFAGADRKVIAERLVIWKGPPPADFARHPRTLLELALAHQADTVVIDSLKDAATALSEDEAGSQYNRARQLALVEGVELIELHHNKKSAAGTAARTLEDVYGSRWLTAGAGSVIFLWGQAGDPIVELHHLKQVAGEVGPWQVVHDHVRGTSEVFRQTDLVQLAAAAGDSGGLTVAAAASALFSTDKPTNSQVEKARRKLANLVSTGQLVQHPGSGGGAAGNTGARYFRSSSAALATTHGPTHAAPSGVSTHEGVTTLTSPQVSATLDPTHATLAPDHSRSAPPLKRGPSGDGVADPATEAARRRGRDLLAEHGQGGW